MALEKDYDVNRHELQNLSKNLQDTQLQISQVCVFIIVVTRSVILPGLFDVDKSNGITTTRKSTTNE